MIGWKAFKTFKDYIVLFSNGFQVCGGSMRRKYKEKVWGGFLRKVWVGLIKDFEKGKEKEKIKMRNWSRKVKSGS